MPNSDSGTSSDALPDPDRHVGSASRRAVGAPEIPYEIRFNLCTSYDLFHANWALRFHRFSLILKLGFRAVDRLLKRFTLRTWVGFRAVAFELYGEIISKIWRERPPHIPLNSSFLSEQLMLAVAAVPRWLWYVLMALLVFSLILEVALYPGLRVLYTDSHRKHQVQVQTYRPTLAEIFNSDPMHMLCYALRP
jgi:hypothetical protein